MSSCGGTSIGASPGVDDICFSSPKPCHNKCRLRILGVFPIIVEAAKVNRCTVQPFLPIVPQRDPFPARAARTKPLLYKAALSLFQMAEVNRFSCGSFSNRATTSRLGSRLLNSLSTVVSSKYTAQSNSGAGRAGVRCRCSSISSMILKNGSSFGMPFGL